LNAENKQVLSSIAEMDDRLTTAADMGQKRRSCCAPFRGVGSPSNTWSWAYRSPYQVHMTSLIDPCSRLARIYMVRKLGECPLGGT